MGLSCREFASMQHPIVADAGRRGAGGRAAPSVLSSDAMPVYFWLVPLPKASCVACRGEGAGLEQSARGRHR